MASTSTKRAPRQRPAGGRTASAAREPDAYYVDAALYERNFAHKTEDIDYYLALAEGTKGPLLEYGAGAGRVTLPLARAGHRVTAVDRSPAMLALLRRRLLEEPEEVRRNVRIVRGDMRRLSNLGRHELVLATFNVVGHLHRFEEFAAFLGHVKAHLRRGGTFVFDVPVPSPEELGADPDDVFPAPRFRHPTTGAWVREEERFAYDAVTQILTVESSLSVDGYPDPLTIPLRLRQWFPKELEALLVYEGFRDVRRFADYTDEPALGEVDMLVVHARAP